MDKILHFGLGLALGLLAPLIGPLPTILTALVIAVGLEIYHYFTPGRFAEIGDIVATLLGTGLGILYFL
jgi:VanZ family protein